MSNGKIVPIDDLPVSANAVPESDLPSGVSKKKVSSEPPLETGSLMEPGSIESKASSKSFKDPALTALESEYATLSTSQGDIKYMAVASATPGTKPRTQDYERFKGASTKTVAEVKEENAKLRVQGQQPHEIQLKNRVASTMEGVGEYIEKHGGALIDNAKQFITTVSGADEPILPTDLGGWASEEDKKRYMALSPMERLKEDATKKLDTEFKGIKKMANKTLDAFNSGAGALFEGMAFTPAGVVFVEGIERLLPEKVSELIFQPSDKIYEAAGWEIPQEGLERKTMDAVNIIGSILSLHGATKGVKKGVSKVVGEGTLEVTPEDINRASVELSNEDASIIQQKIKNRDELTIDEAKKVAEVIKSTSAEDMKHAVDDAAIKEGLTPKPGAFIPVERKGIKNIAINELARKITEGETPSENEMQLFREHGDEIGVAVEKIKEEKAVAEAKKPITPTGENGISPMKADGVPEGNKISAQVLAAPFYDLTVKDAAEADKIRESPAYKKYVEVAHENADIVGAKIISVEPVVGDFKNAEGNQLREVSDKFHLEVDNLDQAEEFAALIGSRGLQTQESTIASAYTTESKNAHNTYEYNIKVDDVAKASDLLREVGIENFNANKDGVTILQLNDYPIVGLIDKLHTFDTKLKENGITRGKISAQPVESRYIGARSRAETLARIRDRVGREPGREDIRAKVDKAIESNEQFREHARLKDTRDAYTKLRQKQIELHEQSKELSEAELKELNEHVKKLSPNIERTLESREGAYKEAKAEIDNAAKEVVGDRGFVLPFDIKKIPRATTKTLEWYDGKPDKLGDGARTTIITPDMRNSEGILQDLRNKYPGGTLRDITETTKAGYPKRLLEVITSNGRIAEFQVMTPEGYLAKEGLKEFTPETKELGEKALEKVRKETGQDIPDGMGHWFYEISRDNRVQKELRDEAERVSKDYYKAFTDTKAFKESGVDINKEIADFKAKVEGSDRSGWSKDHLERMPKSEVIDVTRESKVELSEKEIALKELDEARAAFRKAGGLSSGGLEAMPEFVAVVKAAIKAGYYTAKEFIKEFGDDFKNYKREDVEATFDEIYEDIKKTTSKKLYDSEVEAKKATDEKASKRDKLNSDNPQLELKDETWFDKLATAFQNRFMRLGKVQEAAKKSGIKIIEDLDADMANELLTGRAKARIDRIENEVVKSKANQEPALFERMGKDNIGVDDLGLYMYAKHATERNAKVSRDRRLAVDEKIRDLEDKIKYAKSSGDVGMVAKNERLIDDIKSGKNKEYQLMDDGGSGMTNLQAKEILEAFDVENKSELLDIYASEFRDKVINKNLDNMFSDGLINKKQYEELKSQFKHYVPLLVGEKMEGKVISKGKSVELKGRDIHRAKGSNLYGIDQRVNPVVSSLFNYQKEVIRGEKNKAVGKFYNLAKEIGDPLFKVHEPKSSSKVNADGGVDYTYENYTPKTSDNTIEFKMGGKPVLIEVNDQALLSAMKGVGVTKAIPLLDSLNSFLRGVNTIYNPEFMVSNFIRDVQTSIGNLSSEKINGIQANTIKNIPSAMKGVWDSERGVKSEWSDIVQEMKDEGGDVSWLQIGDINEYSKNMSDNISKYNSNKTPNKFSKVLGGVLDYYQVMGKVAEMSTRVSAYKAAKDGGVSPAKAAQLAKNLTVNFEKKGNLGATMNSLYLFANAGIQGNARMLTALAKSKKARAVAGAAVAGSVAMNILNGYINQDEYDKIDEGIKERNLVIMHPNGSYNKLPLPYGYNIFKVIGDAIYETSTGKKRVGDGISKVAVSVANAFNPLSSATLNQMISPTITDPFVQLSENKNWRGAPIVPQKIGFQPEKKESSKYFSTVRPITRAVTDAVNDITGGTHLKAGYVDISPEAVDHVVDYFSGGSGKFVMNIFNGAYQLKEGEVPNIANIPFAKTFYGKPSDYRDTKIIYDMKNNSYKEEFSKKEKDSFYKSLDNAKKEGKVDDEDYEKIKKDFNKGQEFVGISNKYPWLNLDEIKIVHKLISQGRPVPSKYTKK